MNSDNTDNNLHFSSFQRDDHLVIGNKVRLWTVECDLHFFLYTWVAKTCYPVMSITSHQRYVKYRCPHRTADDHTYAEGRLSSRLSGNWEKLHMVEHSGSDTAMNSQQTPPHHLKKIWYVIKGATTPSTNNTTHFIIMYTHIDTFYSEKISTENWELYWPDCT